MIGADRVAELARAVTDLRDRLERLRELGSGINCVEKNLDRISACLRMLELNIIDAAGGEDA